MILFSFVTGMTKWGNSLLMLNNISDIPLNLGRLFNEINGLCELPATLMFLTLMVSWVVFRFYGTWYEILGVAFWDSMKLGKNDKLFGSAWMGVSCAMVLFVMNIYWFY